MFFGYSCNSYYTDSIRTMQNSLFINVLHMDSLVRINF